MAETRHPSVIAIMDHFDYTHLPEGCLRETSKRCAGLATTMFLDEKLDGAELTVGLRKLLEAKDCFVRAAVSGTT